MKNSKLDYLASPESKSQIGLKVPFYITLLNWISLLLLVIWILGGIGVRGEISSTTDAVIFAGYAAMSVLGGVVYSTTLIIIWMIRTHNRLVVEIMNLKEDYKTDDKESTKLSQSDILSATNAI